MIPGQARNDRQVKPGMTGQDPECCGSSPQLRNTTGTTQSNLSLRAFDLPVIADLTHCHCGLDPQSLRA